MKRLLLALVLAGLLVGVVGATSLNFQDAGDLSSIKIKYNTGNTIPSNNLTWIHSESGGNSYLHTHAVSYGSLGFSNADPYPMTYAAATVVSASTNVGIILYDSLGNLIYTTSAMDGTAGSRWEVNVVGAQAYIYRDGVFVKNSTLLSVNPSYVSFGTIYTGYPDGDSYWDDVVFGENENKYIFGNPESDAYSLRKDMANPASSGLYASNGTLVGSNNMTSTWGKGNITYTGNQTIVLENIDTGAIYGTRYTDLASAGSVSWALGDEIFNSGAPYGRYYVTIPGTGAYSEEIWYLGAGATISFDKSDYSGQDIATMTYSVLGAYWDTSTYSYSIDVVSGTTGATMQSTAISSSSGTEDYTFTSTDPLGVYYAIVKATKYSDGSVIWMNYDYAELTSYITLSGYVNDAETGLPISGANANITQNSIINNLTTIADGNYSATNYLSGMAITINATAPSYRQYSFTFTPLSPQTININISLAPLSPTVSGLGIGGIARETAYGRPLSDVSVWVVNTSNSQSYTKSTSFTGWYLCDEGASCFLTTKRPYDVWGEKPGYSNSINATAVAP